jgi:putative intracellular protease/amidase
MERAPERYAAVLIPGGTGAGGDPQRPPFMKLLDRAAASI